MKYPNNRSCFFALTPLALALACAPALAAQRVDLHQQDVARMNAQYRAATARAGVAAQAADRHAEMLALEPESNLRLLRTPTPVVS